MVKPGIITASIALSFESDVIPDSGKTLARIYAKFIQFESDVIPDSGKTEMYECEEDY